MNVGILAAGFGTRLDKLGEQCPKGLIPYKDTTLLGRMLTQLTGFNIALVTNNKFFSAYTDYLAENFSNLHVQVVNNGVDTLEKRLGALGDLKLTLDKLNWYGEDLLVLSCDTYFTFPISELLAFYEKHMGFTTVLHDVDMAIIKNRLGCGVMEGDRIIEFAEKSDNPSSNLAAVPLYIYPKELLPRINDYMKTGEGIDSPGKIIPWLLENNIPVWGYTYQGEYLDVGTLGDLDKLKTI